MFLFTLVLNVGHTAETFSEKGYLANASARMKRSKEAVDVMGPSKLKAVTDPPRKQCIYLFLVV